MDEALDERILSVLPVAKGWDRVDLLKALGPAIDPHTLAVLIPIVDGTAKRPASERAAAIQRLGAGAGGADHVEIYALALKDRDLFVQCLALTQLRRWDRAGAAAPSVLAWVKRRLTGRASKKITDFTELPMAVGYFADINDLPSLASLLERYDDQLGPVERAVLEFMWPRVQRQLWEDGNEGDRPNLDGLGEGGHSDEFYLRFDAEVEGVEYVTHARELTADEKAVWQRDEAIRLEATLLKLERRRHRSAGG